MGVHYPKCKNHKYVSNLTFLEYITKAIQLTLIITKSGHFPITRRAPTCRRGVVTGEILLRKTMLEGTEKKAPFWCWEVGISWIGNHWQDPQCIVKCKPLKFDWTFSIRIWYLLSHTLQLYINSSNRTNMTSVKYLLSLFFAHASIYLSLPQTNGSKYYHLLQDRGWQKFCR